MILGEDPGCPIWYEHEVPTATPFDSIDDHAMVRSIHLPYLLGVDIGSGTARTAICRRAPELAGWCPPEPVVTDSPPAVPGLFRRCGDDVPVYSDDLFITPQALVVEQARRAADTVWERQGEAPERVAVAVPTSWGPSRVGLLRAA